MFQIYVGLRQGISRNEELFVARFAYTERSLQARKTETWTDMKQDTDNDTRNQLLTVRTNIQWVYQTNGVYPRIQNFIEKSEAAEFWVVSLKLPELMAFENGLSNRYHYGL